MWKWSSLNVPQVSFLWGGSSKCPQNLSLHFQGPPQKHLEKCSLYFGYVPLYQTVVILDPLQLVRICRFGDSEEDLFSCSCAANQTSIVFFGPMSCWRNMVVGRNLVKPPAALSHDSFNAIDFCGGLWFGHRCWWYWKSCTWNGASRSWQEAAIHRHNYPDCKKTTPGITCAYDTFLCWPAFRVGNQNLFLGFTLPAR